MPKPAPILTDQTNLLPPRLLIPVLFSVACSLFLTSLDQNAISVALPTIGKDLHAEDTISWAGTSALIANTVFQVLYGRLSDIFGRKVVFVTTMTLLGLADLGCGLARTSTQLYVLRGLAGVANGGIVALSMMILSDVVTLKQRGLYQGILGAMYGLGNMIGPFIFAAFITKSTWRGMFYLITPLCIISAAAITWIIPSTPTSPTEPPLREKVKMIDFLGVFTSAAAIVMLLVPISGGGDYFPWSSPMVIAMLTVGGALSLCFIFVEIKLAPLPMMPMRLYKKISVAAIMAQNFLAGIVYNSDLYYLTFYYQLIRGWDATLSAALIVPFLGVQSLFSILAGQYTSRTGRYGEVIWFGYIMWTLGTGLKCIFDRKTSTGVIAGSLIIEGVGAGCVIQTMLVVAQAHTYKADRAVVISVRNFVRCLGGAVGIAISAALLANTLHSHLPTEQLPKNMEFSTYAIPDLSGLNEELQEAVMNAYMTASRAVFILQVPFMGACLLMTPLIRDKGLEREDDPDAEEATLTDNEGVRDPDDTGVDGPTMAHQEPSGEGIEEREKEKEKYQV